jgi:lipoprotein-releasing system permease protein
VVKAVETPPRFTGLEVWPQAAQLPPVVVGETLLERLQLVTGDQMTVRLPPRSGSWLVPRLRLDVAGSFQLAFSEFDERWVLVPLEALLRSSPDQGVAGVEIEVADAMSVGVVRERVESIATETVVTDWREMNSALFAALRWQTLSLFVVLSLVVAVASFQVSSAMVVLAIEKRRSTGVLQALGLPVYRLRRLLMLVGTFLGCAGVGLGMVVGASASQILTELRVVRFPPGLAEVYMVDAIPFEVSPGALVTVAAVGFTLVWLASLWPAWRASKIEPVQALKAV